MTIFRSKSFSFLVFSGLVLVALPLVVVVVASDVLMGRLVTHSSTSVYRSVSSAQLSQKLIETLTNQERRVRQYQVLGDVQLFDDVVVFHQEIVTTLEEFQEFIVDEEQRERVLRLTEQEEALFSIVFGARERWEKSGPLSELFSVLNTLGKELYQHSNEATYQEVENLKNEATWARSILFSLACTLVPITAGLIGFLARFITRPIKEIDQGISQLGQGDFSTPIKIHGSDDLVFLGQRLNWLRNKLFRYEKEKNKFAAHISHELKTPLSSIYEGAELLSDEIVGQVNGKQREVIEILRKNCSHLQALIENLISYTMAQAQKSSLTVSHFSVKELVAQCVDDYTPAILNNQLSLSVQIEPFEIVADREKMKAVIDNLLSNAVKYSPVAGEIRISGSKDMDFCSLLVADSGPGVADEDRDFIFSPFYQGRSAGPTQIKGTGLGLAIAHEYVAAHGGKIEICESPLPGACFKVVLPVDEQVS